MAAQSGSITTSVCLLLLVLLPLTLAQDDCDGPTPFSPPSPNWPDCLPNRLNGTNTYYYRPENTSCPAQPCLTLTQLGDEFFVLTNTDYQTAPIGDTSLVFLPGAHTLDYSLRFFGENSAFYLIGFQNHLPPTAIINCHYAFSGFKDITITSLQFSNCVVNASDSELLIVDYAIFDDTLLDVRSVDSANITNSLITITAPDYYCASVVNGGVFHIVSSHTRLRNVSFSSNHSQCGNVVLLSVVGGSLDIADCAFLAGKVNHIDLSSTILNVSGTVQFENGNPAIQALNSPVNLAGTIQFENGNTAIQAANSPVDLAGNVSFINNTAYQGGSMSLSNSHVTIADNAHVIFQGSHAYHVGGAIFSTANDISNYISVGLRADSCQISFGFNSRVEFINNTAETDGSAMYGITVSKMVCGELDQYPSRNPYEQLFDILTIEPDDFSAVSSDPLRICICPPDQSTPDCLAILPDQNIPRYLHYTVYPGQKFTIPAAVVGFNLALATGAVYAKFLNSDASLGSESQYVQGVSHTGCAPLQYSVLSDKEQETLVLTTNGRSVAEIPMASGIEGDIRALNENSIDTEYNFLNPNKYYNNNTIVTNQTDGVFRMAGYVPISLQDTPIFISITLLDCPLGFTLSIQECKCYESILTCNISDQTVHREGSTWMNASLTGNSSNGVIVHQACPFGYCKQEASYVNLKNPDTQCAFDHSGTLCGAYKTNFSLALGSYQCLPNCSNRYLLLLIPFALAGFALVFFIKILNLTVSQGTMNGLIFYANIIAANRSIFFPAQYNKFLSFLSVFISWLNLDFGIETCFINGLDGYWKTWLQFVFPFYVWAIAGAITLILNYSKRATKIFGHSSFSVSATLFLLSYAKLLLSIITIITIATLVYPADDTTSEAVWAFDGNVKYLSPKHIPLFIFALAIVLLLWLPYTAVLLTAQWLRRKTYIRHLQWLKPLLDAYIDPFKHNHQSWVGFLLVVRGVLFLFFAIENNVNLLLISICSVSLATYTSITGRLYKKVYVTALENSFFLNLGVLAAGTLYIRLVSGNQEALITTSVGIAFLQFIGITIFHSYRFVIVPVGKKCKDYKKTKAEHQARCRGELEADTNSDEDRCRNVEATHSEVHLPQRNTEEVNPTSIELAEININRNRDEILLPFSDDLPQVNTSTEAAVTPEIQSEASAVPSDEPESKEQVHVPCHQERM